LNGKYAIQRAGNAGGLMWSADEERIKPTAEKNIRYEYFIFEFIPVGGKTTEYPTFEPGAAVRIADSEGRYLTNTSVNGVGGTPEFMERKEDSSQLWHLNLVVETGRFNLISAADGRYVNEIGNFGSNPYNALWNTYVLTEQNGKFAIRNAGNGGSSYWIVNGKHISTANIPAAESYQFQIEVK
jgi:hypothetical protein